MEKYKERDGLLSFVQAFLGLLSFMLGRFKELLSFLLRPFLGVPILREKDRERRPYG